MSFRKKAGDPYILTLAGIAIALIAILSVAMPNKFLDPDNFASMGVQAAELGMFGVAMTVAMLLGGIDLSIVAVANLAAILAGLVIRWVAADAGSVGSVLPAFAAGVVTALAVGVVAGLLNGLLVAVIGVPSILATLGTMTLLTGLAFGITGGAAVFGLPDPLVDAANAAIWAVPIPFILFLLVWALVNVVLRRTAFGQSVILIGTSLRVAQFSGVPTGRTIVGVYMITSLISAMAGLINLLRTNSAHADYGGSYVLLSILIAVLGGVSVTGGAGRLIGVLWAIVVLQTLSTGLNMLLIYVSDGPFLRDFVWGFILLAVMVMKVRLEGKRR